MMEKAATKVSWKVPCSLLSPASCVTASRPGLRTISNSTMPIAASCEQVPTRKKELSCDSARTCAVRSASIAPQLQRSQARALSGWATAATCSYQADQLSLHSYDRRYNLQEGWPLLPSPAANNAVLRKCAVAPLHYLCACGEQQPAVAAPKAEPLTWLSRPASSTTTNPHCHMAGAAAPSAWCRLCVAASCRMMQRVASRE
eukprot:GHRQ01037100.1.p1 GENE.GHRQ01037100.1~~GHRQ01037100.1.p1  ORF type:complete len:202 (+),score=46.42 GHRQ01037100.1:146-751(+)